MLYVKMMIIFVIAEPSNCGSLYITTSVLKVNKLWKTIYHVLYYLRLLIHKLRHAAERPLILTPMLQKQIHTHLYDFRLFCIDLKPQPIFFCIIFHFHRLQMWQIYHLFLFYHHAYSLWCFNYYHGKYYKHDNPDYQR